jgi:hypothetical protein
MSATSIYINGRLTRIPGSYSEVNASALEAIGLAASGYIACIGLAYGGKPYDAVDVDDVVGTLQKSTRPGMAQNYFEAESPLLKAEDLLFAPSNEEDIAGAQRVYWIKANPADPSTVTLNNGDGAALVGTSKDYGYRTTRINIQQGDGTNQGKMITVVLDDVEETFDDIGGDGIFKVKYEATTPALGFTTITFEVTSAKTEADFTRTQLGLDTDISNQVVVGGYSSAKVELVSDDAGDAQTVTLYGVDGSGTAVIEELTVAGLTVVTSVSQYAEIHGARISAAPTGTVTIRNLSGGSTITTLTSGAVTKALGIGSELVVGGSTLTIVADAATTAMMTIIGRNANGVVQGETVTLNGTSSVTTTASWTYIDYIAVGAVAAARTVTISGVAATAPFSGYATLEKQADYYNSKDGFTFTKLYGVNTFAMSNMDTSSPVSIKGAFYTFDAVLYLEILTINNGSSIITAARGTPGTGAPTNTTTPVYLTGGHEGDSTPGSEGVPTAVAADWQASLDLCKKFYVNTIVMLTADPAVAAMLKTHNAYMAGAGKMERDGVVGLMNAGLTAVPTKAEIKSQIIALNTRHLRAVAQQCERYNADGEQEKMDPYYTACLVAGAQAGSPLGTSLTWKLLNTLGVYGSSTWNQKDDADEMIEMGLMFAEQVDGVGHRWVRNVTTHLTTSNLAYTEGSVNEAFNYAIYNYRTALETAVGERGFAGTVQAADGVARGILDELMEEALTGWRSLSITLLADVMETSVEMAPVIPVNFVKNYVHLYIAPVSAAA